MNRKITSFIISKEKKKSTYSAAIILKSAAVLLSWKQFREKNNQCLNLVIRLGNV